MYDPYEPLFPFGYGLTYTSFEYTDLRTGKQVIKDGETIPVTFTLENTGDYDSDEVVQLYVRFPESKVERPAKALKGFKRVFVPKGTSMEVTVPLDSEDLKYWDTVSHQFVLEPGTVQFFIGPSSVEERLIGTVMAE
jgi:beta-glucosidase